MAYLEMIRDATIAITGQVLGPAGAVADATIEVLEGERLVLVRRSFTTGVYTVPRLRLRAASPTDCARRLLPASDMWKKRCGA